MLQYRDTKKVEHVPERQEKFAPLIPTIGDDALDVVDNNGNALLIETDHKAPDWRVVAIDPARAEESNWKMCCPRNRNPFRALAPAAASCSRPIEGC